MGRKSPHTPSAEILKEIPQMWIPGPLQGGEGLPELSLDWKLGSFECKCACDLSF